MYGQLQFVELEVEEVKLMWIRTWLLSNDRDRTLALKLGEAREIQR